MGRGRQITDTVDMLAYERPAPAKAAFIVHNYGMEAARERWPFLTAHSIFKIVQTHNENQRAATGDRSRGPRRTTPLDQEDEAVRQVFALGSPSRAAKATGLSYSLVMTVLRERGISDYPRVGGSERGRLAAETRARRQAEAVLPPPTVAVVEEVAPVPAPAGDAVPPVRGHRPVRPAKVPWRQMWRASIPMGRRERFVGRHA